MVTTEQLDVLAFCAFRYALKDHSYVVLTVANSLIQNADVIGLNAKRAIASEIRDAIQADNAGVGMDVAEWHKVLVAYTKGESYE